MDANRADLSTSEQVWTHERAASPRSIPQMLEALALVSRYQRDEQKVGSFLLYMRLVSRQEPLSPLTGRGNGSSRSDGKGLPAQVCRHHRRLLPLTGVTSTRSTRRPSILTTSKRQSPAVMRSASIGTRLRRAIR